MTLQQQERELEMLEQEEGAAAEFVSSLDIRHLQMFASLVNNELVLRYEGKPMDRRLLH